MKMEASWHGESFQKDSIEHGAEKTRHVQRVERNLELATAESKGEPGQIKGLRIPGE